MPRVYLRELDPALSADHAALCLGQRRGLAWLDGGLTYGREGRWSFVGVEPVKTVERTAHAADPLAALAELALPEDDDDADAPFARHQVPAWAGFIGYDAHPFTADAGRLARDAGPVLCLGRYDAWLAFDHAAGRVYVVGDDERACEALLGKLAPRPLSDEALDYRTGPVEATAPLTHREAVERALAHIVDGDVYEINLARRFACRFSGSALGLYRVMRRLSPVPLGMYFSCPGTSLLGRSMERFLRYERESGRIWTSPIKGTLPRHGADDGAGLAHDPKEHAEHAMVVDLMRNDLSRVALPGTVQIEALMEVLPFAGLFHLVSTVTGQVRPGLSLCDVVRETFPPGSVTGTPKRRTLALIEALEPHARGLYTGAYGVVDRAGGCSLAVAIRTAVLRGDTLSYWAGGGIVAKSQPEREVEETALKAQLFLRAIGAEN